MSDIRIRYIEDLPCSVHAFTVKEDADSYDIYVNPKLSYEAQIEAFEHEVEHITKNDFNKQNVNDAEL